MANLFVESCWSQDFWKTAKITSQDIVFPIDGFSDQWLENLIVDNEIPRAVITEYSFYKHPKFDLHHIGLPLWLNYEVKNSKKFVLPDPEMVTRTNFNFMIKKKRLTRFLLCKCIELYALKNYDYTWIGDDRNFDLSSILNDIRASRLLSPKEKSFMLSEISMSPRYINPGFKDDDPAFNLMMWESHLDPIISGSAISLITETIEDTQQVSMFTEKTLFSVLGFTFPIWPGSYAQADLWKEMGLDAFDDVIDHSYQYEESIFDRVVKAIKDNLHLLRDIELAGKLRNQCRDRFKKNKDLLLSDQVSMYIDEKINKLPDLERRACEIIKQVYTNKRIQGVHNL